MAYFEKPRIVVEQSPWQTFFEKLPDLFLSFHKLKLQAEESEKDRQFKLQTIYLQDKLEDKRMTRKAAIEAHDDARDKGLALDSSLFNVQRDSSVSTQGGSNLKTTIEGWYEDEKQLWVDRYNEADKEVQLANLGEKAAMAIDKNFSGTIDPNEIKAYTTSNPDLLKQLGVNELPESFIVGAEHYLNKPAVRTQQKKNKAQFIDNQAEHAVKDFMASWDDERDNITPEQLGERNQARMASMIPGKGETMIKHFLKSYDIKDTTTGAVGTLGVEEKNADKIFRNTMDIFQEQAIRAHPKVRAALAWGAGQDFKEGGFILNVDAHKENLEKNMEKWFTKTSGRNAKRWISKKYKKYYNDPKNTGTEIEKRAHAVAKMFIDPQFTEAIAEDKDLHKLFGLTPGNQAQEEAAVQLFRTNQDMYDQASQWSGRDPSGSALELLKRLKITKTADDNKNTLEDDWLYREKIIK